MKEKILAMLLAAVLSTALLPTAAMAADDTGGSVGDIDWKLTGDGVLTISGTGDIPQWLFTYNENIIPRPLRYLDFPANPLGEIVSCNIGEYFLKYKVIRPAVEK